MNNYRLLVYLSIVFLIVNLGLLGVIFFIKKQIAQTPAEVFVVEEYRKANIEVNTAVNWGKTEPFWQSFSQGGEEMGGVMLTPTVLKMKQLRPKYIRLDHIFDDDYYGVVRGKGNYDFSKLDKTVNEILTMGAKPFFSLGYMPKSVAESKISVPYDWNRWHQLVKATVEHYSGKNAKNLTGIYYEVWNEPDLESFGSWRRSGAKNYLTLYSVSAKAAVSAVNTNRFYIGGPATTALYKNWVLDLVNFTKANGLRLDFISWHRYSYSPKRFYQDMKETYDWMGDKRDDYQWLITEWGPTPEKSGSYSSGFAAAHAFAVVRQIMDTADGMYAFEVKDGPGQGSQGWGILAHQSAGLWLKPRFKAFSWLKDAGGDRLGLGGEGTNVTGWALHRQDNSFDLYLVNYSASGSKVESVPIRFINLSPGNYFMRQTFFTDPKQNLETTTETKTGRLFLNLDLKPNEIVRVTLKQNQVVNNLFQESEEASSFSRMNR